MSDPEQEAPPQVNIDATEAPPGAAQRGVGLLTGKLKAAVSGDLAASLIGQFIASIILIIAVTVINHSTVNWDYAVSVGSVSAFFSLLGLLLLALQGPGDEKVLFTAPVVGDLTLSRINGFFLMIWWAIGMGILTFNNPFTTPGNGYFAVWFGFMCAVASVGLGMPALKHIAMAYSPFLLGFIVAALVVGLELCVGQPHNLPVNFVNLGMRMAFGLIAASLGLFVGLTMLFLEMFDSPMDPKLRRAILTTTTIFWGLAALWLTFSGPFTGLGNGYFGLWGGMICVSRLMMEAPTLEAPAEDEDEAPVTRASVNSFFDKLVENEKLSAMWGMAVASLVLVLAVAFLPTSTDLWDYSLAVGIVGLFFSVAGALLLNNPAGNKPLVENAKTGPITLNFILAIFLFLWWAVGVGFLTIRNPFTGTGNGFFAVWAGFASSLFGIGMTFTGAKAAASSGIATQALLVICAFVIIVEMAQFIGKYDDKRAQNIYALVIACISFVMGLVAIVLKHLGKPLPEIVVKILSVIRFIVWAVLASWVTFVGPFNDVNSQGNGYFAAWGGLFCTVILILAVWMPELLSSPEKNTSEDFNAKSMEEGSGYPSAMEGMYGDTTYATASYESAKPVVESYDTKPAASYAAPDAKADMAD